ncbi:glycosyltransferase family 2 protein [Chelativorans sp. M5D2P16]|uniref:glycosyltransferase family 2 protein n=1 Tax=Chelativorans sp. M5D2P16 TaxID=3095678 RepID=UPI002ACA7BAF|nr:glycosyltransferase family 2 protein [Chelativorans sp. M5D2P16]MDZ5696161.1 glycosyltransferase family 2 protein [Chelativorans sp. M5D2P16]
MNTRIAVVIPYFQRKPGILRRAVDSVIAQNLPGGFDVKIVVVDDESPLSPQNDLRDLDPPSPYSIVVLNRSNGGPGAARNTGLDHLDPAETDFVAFLDSDDVWFSGHLRQAVAALADGADFYFANSMHDSVTSFSYYEYMTKNHDVRVGAQPESRSISGNEAFNEFLVHCIPHTSNVVYKFPPHCDVRFAKLRRTGEDQLFWITLAKRSSKVSYSTAVMGTRGEGVSVYREALAWDSVNAPDRLIDGLVFRDKLATTFDLDPTQRRLSEQEAQVTRDHLVFLCLRNLRYRPLATLHAALRISRELPSFWLHFPKTCLRVPAHYRTFKTQAAVPQL